jgi:hypothetical protein
LKAGGLRRAAAGLDRPHRAAAALEPAGELDAGETGGNMSEEQTLRQAAADPCLAASGWIARGDDEYSEDDYDVADDADDDDEDFDEDGDDDEDDDEDFADDDEEDDLDEEDDDDEEDDAEDLDDDDEDFDDDDEEDEDEDVDEE